jgi:WD40 repeat protein
MLFSLSGDGELGVIRIPQFNIERKILIGKGKLRAVAVNAAETIIALGSGDGSIYVFSLPDLKPLKHFQAHKEGFSVNALQFSPCDKQLISGSRDAYLNVYDVENDFQVINAIPAHNYAIYSISYSPDRKLFATGSRDKTVKIWDAETYEMLYRIDKEKNESHVNSVNKILWHEETGSLFSAGDDRAVMVWKVEVKG